ncbi:cbb3-type cytochrome oxidase subunit 3 [Pseudoduganella chitinolytica]|uniref:Cbb3-type cytochrome c oxidase subunit 3 n=1 Tax=Pseudoduganella chitinolytica TaxID=34070 RepID=A0ABY8B7Y7_9BURK|nr:cbb3-type cytochrome c oxidase subunit 3 [Pseudoduganella chitinolytica]WEF32042.1 cbb3-type cytochrome c oxidase subunit 3 [Pseudoduganella chitinolytica]
MAIEHIFDSASSVMTVVSFITFAGIWTWAWSKRKQADFAQAAQLPFADEEKQDV